MATFERSVRVAAPLDVVWDFHSRAAGLAALTPDWLHLEVEAVRGPDGDADTATAVLAAGSVVRASLRPFGLGPRQRWTTRIVARECAAGAAYVRDVVADGPFPTWEHTHLFYADGDGTLVRDRVVYELPGEARCSALGPLGRLGLEPAFRYRHRRTRALLE